MIIAVRQRPPDVDGQITFGYCANCRNSFIEIHFVIAKREWNDARQDFEEKGQIAKFNEGDIKVN